MITEKIQKFFEGIKFVIVATASASGSPHIAIGEQISFEGSRLVVFENWYCPTTLQNIVNNPYISIMAHIPESGNGYQLIGSIVRSSESETDDWDPAKSVLSQHPQILTRFAVKVEEILDFTSGIHTDLTLCL